MELKPGYKQTEVGLIPDEWDVKSLSDIGNFSKGKGIKKDDVSDEGVACIRYGELYTRYNNYVLRPVSRIPASLASTTLLIMQGDLLFAGSGETAEEIGKCVAYLSEEEAYAGGDIVVLRPSGHNSLYLGHLLNHDIVARQKARLGQGDAVVHISAHNLAMIKLPLPSKKDEQDAIAEALADVDALLAALDKLIAKKRAIKQAAMQQLLTGKTRLPGYSAQWEIKRLGDVTSKVGSGITPTGGERVYKSAGRPFLRSQNVGWGDLLMDDIAFIDDETHGSFRETEIRKHDVFLNITGASIGRSAVADKRVENGNVNQHVCIIRPIDEQLDPYFLNAFLLSSESQKQIDSFQAGGNRQGLNFGQIKSFLLPLPSLSEQIDIAIVLSDMDAEIAALERRRDKTQQIKQGMMQQLLTGRIRLVNPSPTETPA